MTIYARDIISVEKYLGNKNVTNEQVIKDYCMEYDQSGALVYKGNAEYAYAVLLCKFPTVRFYKNWGDLYLSMKNGSPVRKEPMNVKKGK